MCRAVGYGDHDWGGGGGAGLVVRENVLGVAWLILISTYKDRYYSISIYTYRVIRMHMGL